MSTIKDGTAVLEHDAFDVDEFASTRKKSQVLVKAVDPRFKKNKTSKLPTSGNLIRDLFWAFNKFAPEIAPPVPLESSHTVHEQILNGLFQTREFTEIRNAGTVGNPLISAMAAAQMLPKLVEAIPEAALAEIKDLHEIEKQINALDSELALIQSTGSLSTKHQTKLKSRHLLTAEKNKLNKRLETRLPAIQDSARRASRKQAAQTAQQLNQAKQAIEAFGLGLGQGGAGTGFSLGDGQGLSVNEKLNLTGKVMQSSKLQKIAQMCGRMARIAMRVQKSKTKEPTEVVGIHRGNDLARLLPVELSLLAVPELEDLFYLKLAESQLLQYRLDGRQPQGKGPIIIALDSSGSMSGKREVWSKAVALSLVLIAKKQQRDCAILHFSGGPVKAFSFEKGNAPTTKIIECAEYFEGGGTHFGHWMKTALNLIEGSQFNKADVIVISDGVARTDRLTNQRWQAARREREFKSISILIGQESGGERTLMSLTDHFFKLDDLTEDSDTLKKAFAV